MKAIRRIEQKITQAVVAFFIFYFCVACDSGPDCFIADQNYLVGHTEINNQRYSVYHKISGFQDKVLFYELYLGDPTFDRCGTPSYYSVASDSIDFDQGQPVKLVLSKSTLEIKYSTENNNRFDLKNLELLVQDGIQ